MSTYSFVWDIYRFPDCYVLEESWLVEAFTSWFGSKNAIFSEPYLDIPTCQDHMLAHFLLKCLTAWSLAENWIWCTRCGATFRPSEPFDFSLFPFSFLICTLSELPWFGAGNGLVRTCDGTFIHFYVAPVYPTYFSSLKTLSNWPVHLKLNLLIDLFLKIIEESVILSPNQSTEFFQYH